MLPFDTGSITWSCSSAQETEPRCPIAAHLQVKCSAWCWIPFCGVGQMMSLRSIGKWKTNLEKLSRHWAFWWLTLFIIYSRPQMKGLPTPTLATEWDVQPSRCIHSNGLQFSHYSTSPSAWNLWQFSIVSNNNIHVTYFKQLYCFKRCKNTIM